MFSLVKATLMDINDTSSYPTSTKLNLQTIFHLHYTLRELIPHPTWGTLTFLTEGVVLGLCHFVCWPNSQKIRFIAKKIA